MQLRYVEYVQAWSLDFTNDICMMASVCKIAHKYRFNQLSLRRFSPTLASFHTDLSNSWNTCDLNLKSMSCDLFPSG